MLTYKGLLRKRSCPILRYYPGIRVEGLRKNTKNLRVAGVRAEI
jgi:hypothetical protein